MNTTKAYRLNEAYRLGDLYEDVLQVTLSALEDDRNDAQRIDELSEQLARVRETALKNAIVGLCSKYGEGNVQYMIRVIQDDIKYGVGQ